MEMLSSLVCFFALLLILCGLFFVSYLLISLTLKEDCDGFFVAVEGYECKENLVCEVYSAFRQINMLNFGKKRAVYVIDYDLTEITKADIRDAIEPCGQVVFLKISQDSLTAQ